MHLGKKRHDILLIFFLLFSASASGQAGKSVKYQFEGNLQKSDVLTGNQSITIDYSISELNVESFINESGSYYRISLPDHTPSAIPGKPELPVLSRMISIPEGSGYEVKISEVRSSKINPSRKKIEGILFPAQEGETKAYQHKKPEFLIDRNVYNVRGTISSDTVRIEPLGTVRKNNLANLYISPVRYNPSSNTLEVITSMKIEITFSVKKNTGLRSHFTESALFRESLKTEVLNYDPDYLITGYSDQPVKMVIITDIAFKEPLKPFLRWKTQKGYKLIVLYTGIGYIGNTYTQLKDTLTKIYNASSESDPPPEYLLIIGDVNRIPYYGTGNVTDMYYGEFDGNGDYIPEMFVGRLPVANTTELRSVINKIIQYEKFQFTDVNKFYSRAIVTAGYDDQYANNMNGQVIYAISNYLNTANKIDEYHFFVHQSTTAKDSILKLINKGVSFINYTGHGDETGWMNLNITVSDTLAFKNNNMYPLIISNACRTAEFSLASSFGNKLVVSGHKGAIGFIGCSNDSYWNEDFYWAVGNGVPSVAPSYQTTGLGAYDRLFHTHGETASKWYITMGQINYAGNLAVSTSTTLRKKYYWETYNLIGDPSVIPIIGTPDSFNINLPDTLPNGIKSFSIVAEPFAYVAVSHLDTLWDASFASPSGSVTLNMPGVSNDSCLVVITGQNRYPVIKTIYFSDITQEFINLNSSSILDSLGNNNGLADFGETFNLRLIIGNIGLTDATNLYAKISCTSDLVTITKDSVFIGTLSARSEITVSEGLQVKVSEDAADRSVVTIKLLLIDQMTEKNYSIEITLHTPELQVINCIIDDSATGNGDFIADPGETFNFVFKVSNQGSGDISGQLMVESTNPDIEILQPAVKSGILKFGEVTDIPVLAKLSETLPSGSSVSITSTLNCYPFIIYKDFSFRVGKVRESFEASSFKIFPWINNSLSPWTITTANSFDGLSSAKSGTILHKDSSSLVIRAVYEKDDSIGFFYKVSSEPDYDNLTFKLNDTEVLKKSGEIPWEKHVMAVHAGLNKMEWKYSKDETYSRGEDCAWIDMIDFADSSPVKYIRKDLQVVRILTPGHKETYGMENISAIVRNPGCDVINGFFLSFSLNNSSIQEKQYFENIIPCNDSVAVSFNTPVNLSKFGIYNIVLYGSDNEDDYPANDTARISIDYFNPDDNIRVFPNPYNEWFNIYIKAQAAEKVQISIVNISGEKLYNIEQELIIGNNEIVFSDVKLLPSIYYLNVRGSITNKTIPIIKVIK